MDPLWSGAILAGLAVVAVTWIAGRMGDTIGGLLATAPVTSAAAIIFLALDGGNAQVGAEVLGGGKSLFAALTGMPAYFYALKATRGAPLPLRLALALAIYLLLFTVGTLLAHAITPPGAEALWLVASIGLTAVLAFTFLRARLPALTQRPPKTGITWKEAVLRFVAGAAVVLLVGALRAQMPALSAAWAIFPGTFLVSLGILGMERGAAFSAKASQGAVLGVPPLAAYLITLWALLPLAEGTWWTLASQVPAWCVYFLVMGMSSRLGGMTDPHRTTTSDKHGYEPKPGGRARVA